MCDSGQPHPSIEADLPTKDTAAGDGKGIIKSTLGEWAANAPSPIFLRSHGSIHIVQWAGNGIATILQYGKVTLIPGKVIEVELGEWYRNINHYLVYSFCDERSVRISIHLIVYILYLLPDSTYYAIT